MRVIFMGTPVFAVSILDALNTAGFNVVAVVSQPDREKDKKGNLLSTPVKQYAESHGLQCLQFDRVSQHVSELKEMNADVVVTAAYGQLLSEQVLTVAKHGVLNVHASLLPKYRGSSPIQSAILNGENVSGVTIMKTELSMDTGDIIAVESVDIDDNDTCDSLSEKLSFAGAELLVNVLPKYVAGGIKLIKQNDAEATYCKKVMKSDGLIDWNTSAREISCKIRAYNPWPIAYTYLNNSPLKIYEAIAVDNISGSAGKVWCDKNEIYAGCGIGSLKIKKLQLPGKKVLSADEFLRGHNINGSVFSDE